MRDAARSSEDGSSSHAKQPAFVVDFEKAPTAASNALALLQGVLTALHPVQR